MRATIEIKFEAGHRLLGYDGPCGKLHGHTYTVRVSYHGQIDPDTGMVVDFGALRKATRDLVREWDHAVVLAEDDPLVKVLTDAEQSVAVMRGRPTAENMAKYLQEKLSAMGLWCMVSVREGEGVHTGRPAVFVRLAGCNMRGGPEQGEGLCAATCDTDFSARFGASPEEVVERVVELVKAAPGLRLVVLTGGEPLLQARELCEVIRALDGVHRLEVAIETNGSLNPDLAAWQGILLGARRLWITCSPKHYERLALEVCDELKVLVPCVDPLRVAAKVTSRRGLYYAQPDWNDKTALAWALDFCRHNPPWRLSLQTHKLIGVP